MALTYSISSVMLDFKYFFSPLKKISCFVLVVGFVVVGANSIQARPLQAEEKSPVLRHAAGMKIIGVQGGMSSMGFRVVLDAGYLHAISLQSRLWLATEWVQLPSFFYQNVSLSYLLAKTLFSNHKSFDFNLLLGPVGLFETFQKKKTSRTSFNTGVLVGGEMGMSLSDHADLLIGGGSMFFILKKRDSSRWNHYLTVSIKFNF
jgi:hypothetical protein